MKNRRGLGRGLDALLSDDDDAGLTPSVPESAGPESFPAKAGIRSRDSGTDSDSKTGSVPQQESFTAKAGTRSAPDGGAKESARMIPLSRLRPGAHQPRRDFNEAALEELAESVRLHGVLQPLLARPIPNRSGEYEIVAGERRWRAAGLAGLVEVPALVREMSDESALFAALVENLQRTDLNPMERARGIARLVSELGLTHAEAGANVGLSRPAVTNILRLLDLSEPVRGLLESGKLDPGHARALLGLPEGLQLEAARRIASGGLSAREAERLARRLASEAKGETDGSVDGGKSGGAGAGKSPVAGLDADTRMLERELSSKLSARTEIRPRKDGGGKLTIHYGSLEALDLGVLAKLRK